MTYSGCSDLVCGYVESMEVEWCSGVWLLLAYREVLIDSLGNVLRNCCQDEDCWVVTIHTLSLHLFGVFSSVWISRCVEILEISTG
jgi:hypothetical protein